MKFPIQDQSLPLRPHLDHLKKQAKQLFQAMQESGAISADAQLSDAQKLLAGSYGFRSWADLKQEVELRKPLTRALKELASGGMCILFDDKGRENEGDFVVAAESVTAEQINFMASHGRGAICVALEPDHGSALGLAPLPPSDVDDRDRANFGPSIDLATHHTGISAADRAATIRALFAPGATAEQFSCPGHVPTLIGVRGGLAERQGHTEGSLELVKRAGLKGGAVICEILNPDGTMARFGDLEGVAASHGLALVTTADLLA